MSKAGTKISRISAALITLSSLLIVGVFFFPFWQIQLWAPQYPEGLTMYIWYNTLNGDVNTINGLNHYIGMKQIKAEMFWELDVLKYIISGFILWGLLVAVTRSLKLLVALFIGDLLFAGLALYDFWRWGYDYGHHLNPQAAIQVPGMAYQPPLIGYKQLLNFEAFSAPDLGGWLVVVAGIITCLVLVIEYRKRGKLHWRNLPKPVLFITFIWLTSVSCNPKPEAIQFGKDNCAHCQMTIMKAEFGGELLTSKGKVFKFDDAGCLRDFMVERKMIPDTKAKVYFCDFESGALLESALVQLIHSNSFHTPMNSGVIAVPKAHAGAYLNKNGTQAIDFAVWLAE